MAFKRSINGYEIRRHKAATTADKSVSLPELSDGPVFEIVPIEVRDATDLERLRDELVMPEQQVLDAWVGVLTDDKEEFWGIDAHPLVWRAYAKGLQEWAARPHLYEKHLRRLGEPPYQLSVPEIALNWDDFEYRPEANSLSSQCRNSLYIPCKWAPFCGIGYEKGKPKAFGLLMPDSQGEWPFGAQLRRDLARILSEASSSAIDSEYGGPSVIREETARLVEKAPEPALKLVPRGHGKGAANDGDWRMQATTPGVQDKVADAAAKTDLFALTWSQDNQPLEMLEVPDGALIIQPMDGAAPAVAEWLRAKTTLQWRGDTFHLKPIEKVACFSVIGMTIDTAQKRAAVARRNVPNCRVDSRGRPWLPTLS
jgi:hypothetical protein